MTADTEMTMRRDALDARLPKRPLRSALAALAAVCVGFLTVVAEVSTPDAPISQALPAYRPTFHERVIPRAAVKAPDSALLSVDALRALPQSPGAVLPVTEHS
jgi:hypothetical protein